VILFRNEDDAYFSWLEAHFHDGYVINCYRRPTPAYLVFHKASSHHIQKWEDHTSTGGDYAKVCSVLEQELRDWAGEIGGPLTPCGSCQP